MGLLQLLARFLPGELSGGCANQGRKGQHRPRFFSLFAEDIWPVPIYSRVPGLLQQCHTLGAETIRNAISHRSGQKPHSKVSQGQASSEAWAGGLPWPLLTLAVGKGGLSTPNKSA